MDMLGTEALSIDVGARLTVLRETRGISMRTLAKMSGLSANALSMIERGLSSPSVSTLNKLAAALNVPITAFFREEPDKSNIVFRKASERPRAPFTRGLWEGLGGEEFVGHVEAFLITLENGGNSGLFQMEHTGHEFVFCLRGNLVYEVESVSYHLNTGDSLLFAANLKHRWYNPGPVVTNALIIISGFDAQEHPTEYHFAAQSLGTDDVAQVDLLGLDE